MTERKKRIGQVCDILIVHHASKDTYCLAGTIVDTLFPRKRNSILVEDGRKVEYHSDSHFTWHNVKDGCLTLYARNLSDFGLSDELAMKCYDLINNEWAEE